MKKLYIKDHQTTWFWFEKEDTVVIYVKQAYSGTGFGAKKKQKRIHKKDTCILKGYDIYVRKHNGKDIGAFNPDLGKQKKVLISRKDLCSSVTFFGITLENSIITNNLNEL